MNIFGTQFPEQGIYLPEIPYSVRLNCKDGGLFVGGEDPQHRRSNPEEGIEISIIKVSRYFGSLGKTRNVMWVQFFFIAAPTLKPTVLPSRTVCVSYLKKQSIGHLYHKALEIKTQGIEPGTGIFRMTFNKEQGAKGTYYSVNFEWRARQGDAEMAQLQDIEEFLSTYRTQLYDLEGTREMTCIDGWSEQAVRNLAQEMISATQEPKALKPAR
jgi:hypothetical protein